MKPLQGKIAVVAGATRGAGRGIARMLGEAGATVYCTGRSSRTQPNTSNHPHAKRPETIEETAGMVDAAGGHGIAVRVDHTVETEVEELFQRVQREQQRLDIVVNVITGQAAEWKDFWDLELKPARSYLDGWLWPHVFTAWHAASLMKKQKSGLLVEIIEQEGIEYHGQLFFDLMEVGLKRLAYSLAYELAPHGVTSLAVTPGFMRTEAILDGYNVKESNWRDALSLPDAQEFGWGGSETPCFVGRAIAALAADAQLEKKSGGVFTARELSKEYGFTDIDGTLPDHAVLDEAIRKYLAAHVGDVKRPAYKWGLIRKS